MFGHTQISKYRLVAIARAVILYPASQFRHAVVVVRYSAETSHSNALTAIRNAIV